MFVKYIINIVVNNASFNLNSQPGNRATKPKLLRALRFFRYLTDGIEGEEKNEIFFQFYIFYSFHPMS